MYKYLMTTLVSLSFFSAMAASDVPMSASEPTTQPLLSLDGLKVKDMKLSGDFRYRYESIDNEGDNPETTNVQKLRFRVGLNGTLNDNFKLDFRLASGAGRTSTNQTLGGNTNYDIRIDRASLKYMGIENSSIAAGRMANPFELAGGSDLVWDMDLNFDGISLKHSLDFYGEKNLTLSASRFLIATETATASAADLNAFQVAFRKSVATDSSILFATSYYLYEGINDRPIMLATASGNNTYTCGATECYDDAYNVLDFGFEFKTMQWEQRWSLFANYIVNTATKRNKDGYLAGIKLNELKKKNDWMVSYDFRELKKASTLGAYSDGESFNGGVNGNSHRVMLGYQPGNYWYLLGAYLKGQKNIATGETELDADRVQLDFVAQF